jgi:hypothetical protein
MLTALFFERYCDLSELICDAAYLACPTPMMEIDYAIISVWFRDNYSIIASTHSFTEAEHRAFGRLFTPPTLIALLAADGGNLRGDLLLTQDALSALPNH